jgi:hypothetical protein
MVARPGVYQASNNAGELSPEEHGRTDLKQFYAGMATMLNVEPVPQGGSRLTMRTRHLGRVRKLLVVQAPSATTVDTDPHAAAAVIATWTIAAAQPISMVALLSWSASAPTGPIMQVEYLSGATWLPFGQPFSIDAPGNYAVGLPPRQSVTTAQLRLRMVVAPATATSFTGSPLRGYTETTNNSVARVRPFTFSLSQTYTAVFTEAFVDFYRDGIFVGTAVTNLIQSQIVTADIQQRLDTMLLFHDDNAPTRILRNGADNQWVSWPAQFETLPTDYNAA